MVNHVVTVHIFQSLCDICFVIFMFTWTLRLGIFPTWIIYTTTVEAAQVIRIIFISDVILLILVD